LKLSGHEVENADCVSDAWAKLKIDHFDLICLDIGLPDGSGLELCEKLRATGDDTPVLFLSARTDEATVVKAISGGGDDYLRKPFGLEELKVRMNKILRRFSPPTSVITIGALVIDPTKRMVTFMDQIINLGRKELEILTLLAKKAGDIVTRENILNAIYESADLYDRTVDSHMSHLRKKLKAATGTSIQISSVYGLGYRLDFQK
jgi:DNA-binding response OmpR family regulator